MDYPYPLMSIKSSIVGNFCPKIRRLRGMFFFFKKKNNAQLNLKLAPYDNNFIFNIAFPYALGNGTCIS